MDRYFVHTGTWMGTYVHAARPTRVISSSEGSHASGVQMSDAQEEFSQKRNPAFLPFFILHKRIFVFFASLSRHQHHGSLQLQLRIGSTPTIIFSIHHIPFIGWRRSISSHFFVQVRLNLVGPEPHVGDRHGMEKPFS